MNRHIVKKEMGFLSPWENEEPQEELARDLREKQKMFDIFPYLKDFSILVEEREKSYKLFLPSLTDVPRRGWPKVWQKREYSVGLVLL